MLDIDPALLDDSEERRQLRAVLREFFAETSGPDDVRKHMAAPLGYDPGLWARMAKEIGVQGLAIPERYGGSGYSFAELAVVLQEAGRVLLSAPLLPTVVLAAHALLLSGDDDACARYLPAIAAGTCTAALAAGGPDNTLRATEGWTVEGEADFVLGGASADLILLAAHTDEGPGLFVCEVGEPGAAGVAGLRRTPRRTLDGTRPQALLSMSGVAVTPVGAPGAAGPLLATVADIGRAALAAEQVGGSGHALEECVAYVGQRRQFGRPIGSFQAVKHRLADLLVEVEAARSAAAYAAACVTVSSPELPVAAAAAAAVCSAAYRLAAEEYVQLHGGIGFTWEHPAHLYVRRARSSEVLLGTADDQLARLAGLLGLGS
jgi:alkylation response protein AidB-like acyl-CoA dehydrogenase